MNIIKIKEFHHKLNEHVGMLALGIADADKNYATSIVGMRLKKLQDVFTDYDNELQAELRERNK